MTAVELFESGQLGEAVEAALADVKKHPTDIAKRSFLCELLCFTGEWERADKQLDLLGTQDPDAMMGVALFRQLIRAEMSRQEFFDAGRVPEFVDGPTATQKLAMEASIVLRDGDASRALELLQEAEEQRPTVKGVCNGNAFEEFRDLDDLVAGSFEVLTTNGKYYWIPVEKVSSIEFRAPENTRDLFWRAAHMIVNDGPDGEVYLPTLYYGSTTHDDNAIRLGKATDWLGEEDSVIRGIGQRMFLIGEEDHSILSLQAIEFES